MIRTQVYLSDLEKQALNTLTKSTGKSQSTLIREAIDEFLEKHANKQSSKLDLIRSAKGLWANRTDLPDFDALRNEFDRGYIDSLELPVVLVLPSSAAKQARSLARNQLPNGRGSVKPQETPKSR